MIGLFEEAVELGVVRQDTVFETAEDFESGVGFQESDEGRDGSKAFETADDECPQESVLGSSISADAGIELGEFFEIERRKQVFILVDDGSIRELIECEKKWQLNFHKKFLLFLV